MNMMYYLYKLAWPFVWFFSSLFISITNINDLMFILLNEPFKTINSVKNKNNESLPLPIILDNIKKIKENKINIEDSDLNDYSKNLLSNEIIEIGNKNDKFKAYYKNSNKVNLIVYFHGCGKSIFWKSLTGDYNYSLVSNFKDDFDIFIPEYPSYLAGNNKKKFELMIKECAKWIRKNYNGQKIIIGGHSFGCWLALFLANKLKDQDINVILNQPFYDNKRAMVWTAQKFIGEKISNFLASVEYDNAKLILKLKKNKDLNIYITALETDHLCKYEDSIELSKLGDKIHFMHIMVNSYDFEHTKHRHINHEQNLWIAKNVIEGKYKLKLEDYNVFKANKNLKHFECQEKNDNEN